MRKIIIITLLTTIATVFMFFSLTKKQNKKISQSTEKLKTLGYLRWVSAKDNFKKSGVVKYNRYLTFKGVNIYNSRNLTTAYIMDMSGNILHSWSKKINRNDSWHHIELCKNGDLFVIVKDKMLIRLDWDSRILWINKNRFHHDIKVSENGDIYSITRREKWIKSDLPIVILDDYICVLSSKGKIKREISLYNVLKDEISVNKIKMIRKWLKKNKFSKKNIAKKEQIFLHSEEPPDIFHTNSIEIIKRDIKGLCKKGDLLISVRELNLIALLDIESEKIIWKWGSGIIYKQHHPTLLENGNILIFDNGDEARGYSRVIELDPLKKKIIWEYKGDSENKFFSKTRGASQRLPNGNTLITESDKGHAFEIKKDGTIVWDFYNPQVKIKQKKRASFYRMIKIFDLKKYSYLIME